MDDQLIHRESVDTETIQYDPPLTIQGLAQSRQFAAHFKRYLKDNGLRYDAFVIKCAPFLKSIMTAAQIALQFD